MTTVLSQYQNTAVERIHRDIAQVAHGAGVSVYLVGGMVRDAMLRSEGGVDAVGNSTSVDMDYVPFGMDYQEFAELVSRKLRTRGVQFKDNTRLSITPAKQHRLYGYTNQHSSDISVDISKPRGNTIQDDLQARDFTINNLAMGMDGSIIGNTHDILHKVINAVSPTTFTDDPLRVLRAYRFQATLGFAVSEQTCNEMRKHQHLLSEIPPERVLKELRSIFASTNPAFMAQGLSAMASSGIVGLVLRGCGGVNTQTLSTIKTLSKGNSDWWQRVQQYQHGFEVLFASVFLLDSNAAATLRNAALANSEQRLIRTLHQLCVATTLPLSTETVWSNYAIVSAIGWVFRLQNQHQNLGELSRTLGTIDRNRGLTLTGNTLIEAGFVPSKGFRQILLEGQVAMATTNLDLGEVLSQLKQRYLTDGGRQQ